MKPQTPKKQSQEKIEFNIKDLFCLLAAYSGRPLEEVREWKIPYFIRMYNTYQKDLKLRQIRL